MTIKEFANKYEIPYNIAYKASYNVKPVMTRECKMDYDEKELYHESSMYALKMLNKYQALAELYQEALQNLLGGM